MSQRQAIWYMEGVSSQRDLLVAAKGVLPKTIDLLASHKQPRQEISQAADFFYLEPQDSPTFLDWLCKIIALHNVIAIHAGRKGERMEQYRAALEAKGVKLVTGAQSLATFTLANDKVAFSEALQAKGLPTIPSIRINSPQALAEWLPKKPFGEVVMCIKPVKGIYGLGFWQLSDTFDTYDCFRSPDSRRANTAMLLNALSQSNEFEPLVLMPYLSGEETSVDLIVEAGRVILAVARTKRGLTQHIEMTNAAITLAKRCAEQLNADGLINIQTKLDNNGQLFILEANLRPSGGVCFGQASGVNLAAYFALYLLGDKKVLAAQLASLVFNPIQIRVDSSAIRLTALEPDTLKKGIAT